MSETADVYACGATIPAVFDHVARELPDAVALIQGTEKTRYQELSDAADLLAAQLTERGVAPGEFVLVRLPRSRVFVAGLLAVLKAGAAYLAADPAWPLEYTQGLADLADAWILTDGSPRSLPLRSRRGVAVTSAEIFRSVGAAWPTSPTRPTRTSQPLRLSRPAVAIDGGDPCAVFRTSGTTGRPKLAVVPHRATVRAFAGAGYADFGPGRIMLQISPVSSDILTLELWSVLLNGGASLMLPASVPMGAETLRTAVAQGVDTVWLAASAFSALADGAIDTFAGVRQVPSGGERISPDHVRRFLATYPQARFVSGYGPAETTVFATAQRITASDLDAHGEVPLGRALPATMVRVLDPDGRPCPEGAPGEIHIGADAVGLGYLGDPAQTDAGFVRGHDGARLYRTGDLGEWDGAGGLLFRGRLARRVEVGGQCVEPEELERFITAQLPGVTAAVTPLRDADGRVIGLIAHCGVKDLPHTPDEISTLCEQRLPRHLWPGCVVLRRQLPRTSGGRVDYEALDRALSAPAAAFS